MSENTTQPETLSVAALQEMASALRGMRDEMSAQTQATGKIEKHLVRLNGSVAKVIADCARNEAALVDHNAQIRDHSVRIAVAERAVGTVEAGVTETRKRSWENYAKIAGIVAQIGIIMLLITILAKLGGYW